LFTTPIKEANTRRLHLENDAGKRMSGLQWDRLEIVTITHSVKVSLPRWNVSCWTGIDSDPEIKQEELYLSLLRAGTIRIVVTHRSAMHRQRGMKGSMLLPLDQLALECPPKRGNSKRKKT
jgi:hypothetical protein